MRHRTRVWRTGIWPCHKPTRGHVFRGPLQRAPPWNTRGRGETFQPSCAPEAQGSGEIQVSGTNMPSRQRSPRSTNPEPSKHPKAGPPQRPYRLSTQRHLKHPALPARSPPAASPTAHTLSPARSAASGGSRAPAPANPSSLGLRPQPLPTETPQRPPPPLNAPRRPRPRPPRTPRTHTRVRAVRCPCS